MNQMCDAKPKYTCTCMCIQGFLRFSICLQLFGVLFFVKCNMKTQVSDSFISQDAFNLAGSKNAVVVIEKQAKKHAFRKNRWLVIEAVAALLESLAFFKSIPI